MELVNQITQWWCNQIDLVASEHKSRYRYYDLELEIRIRRWESPRKIKRDCKYKYKSSIIDENIHLSWTGKRKKWRKWTKTKIRTKKIKKNMFFWLIHI